MFPLFLIYQVGILCQAGRGQNGVDYVTHTLIELCDRDLGSYVLTLACLFAVYGSVLLLLRPRGRFRSESILWVLAESCFYALTMGTVILFVLDRLGTFVPWLAIGRPAIGDIVVISAGAGLHEELLFRVIIMGCVGWLAAGVTGVGRAWVVGLVASSIAFSVAHHVGPGAEAFVFVNFAYRVLAGVFFAIVYHLRGFSVAVWTHALYDVYVLTAY